MQPLACKYSSFSFFLFSDQAGNASARCALNIITVSGIRGQENFMYNGDRYIKHVIEGRAGRGGLLTAAPAVRVSRMRDWKPLWWGPC